MHSHGNNGPNVVYKERIVQVDIENKQQMNILTRKVEDTEKKIDVIMDHISTFFKKNPDALRLLMYGKVISKSEIDRLGRHTEVIEKVVVDLKHKNLHLELEKKELLETIKEFKERNY